MKTEFPNLQKHDVVALDTETTGLKWYADDKPFSFSVAAGTRDYYFDIRETPQAIRWWNDQQRKGKFKVVCHSASFDYLMGKAIGLNIPLDRLEDTAIRACLIDEHLYSYRLDDLGKKYLGVGKIDIWKELADIFGGRPTQKVQIVNLPRAPIKLAASYCNQDARITLDLYRHQEELIQLNDLQQILIFENQLLPYFITNEGRGVRVNIAETERAIVKLNKKIKLLQQKLDKLVGFAINPNPCDQVYNLFEPTQLDEYNWESNDGTLLESTESGKRASITQSALESMTHPAAKLIVQIRKYTKCKNTFLEGAILGNQFKGRVYPSINQVKGDRGTGEGTKGTGTGRVSYSGPALQTNSKRDKELAAIVRVCFLPDVGHNWSVRDWGQSDFRWFAHYSRAPDILAAYRKDPYTDYHQLAADITGIPRDPTPGFSGYAKALNLGLVFGMGEGRCAHDMGFRTTSTVKILPGGKKKRFYKAGPEAKKIFQQYHAALPFVKPFIKKVIKRAKERGYIKTLEGRKMRFTQNTAFKAPSHLFQSGTSEMMKRGYLRVNQYFESEGTGSVILTIHDELDNNIPKGAKGKKIDNEVRKIMQDVDNCTVPFTTSAGMGKNWWDAILQEKNE